MASSPIVDGVVFGPSDGQVQGPPVCAVAVVRGFKGFGKGVSQSDALASAVGEALEHYAASCVKPERILRASFREISDRAFHPEWLCLYNPEQYRRAGFPYPPFHPDKPLHWTPGSWMDNGEPVYLPAFATYLSNAFEGEALCQVTSNGLAAGPTVEDAGRRAALELRERDAFLTSWITRQPGLEPGAAGLDPPIAEIARHLESRGAKLEVHLLAEGPSAFVAASVGLGDGRTWPAVTLGLGVGTERNLAVRNAILEHGQTGPYLARVWRCGEAPIPATPEQIRTLQDHALYYCDPDHLTEFNRWRNASGRPLGTIHSDEVRIAIADLTPLDLMDSPFRVVRALARGLQPIHYGFGLERTYTPRLQSLLTDREPNLAPPPIC